MTKTYVAKRLFEHGPLTFKEFLQITGWNFNTARTTLHGLVTTGILQWTEEMGNRRRVYFLAN